MPRPKESDGVFCTIESELVEDGLPVFKGADITEDFSQHSAGFEGILADPLAVVGIGTHGDDFTAQFLEPAENVRSGQVGLSN